MYDLSLSIAAAVCLAGIAARLLGLRRHRLADDGDGRTADPAAVRGGRGLLAWILGDGLLQARTWKTDRFGWWMHTALAWGFVLLLLTHALEDVVVAPLVPDYAPTRNPFRFLRNLFAAMVLAGVALAAGRRLLSRGYRRVSRAGDWLVLALIATAVATGVLVEGAQMVSEPVFDEMVADYLGSEEDADLEAIRAHWADAFGMVFGEGRTAADPEVRAAGEALHRETCATCHSPPQSAFLSYPVSRALAGAADGLNRRRADIALLRIHYLSCFLLLAAAPFTKLFHLLGTPVTLLARRRRQGAEDTPPAPRSLPALALSGCTRCGVCSRHCSVLPSWRVLGLPEILPSEKLAAIGRGALMEPAGGPGLRDLAEGNAVCTRCGRCSDRCPSGIDLQALWQAVGAAGAGCLEGPALAARRSAAEWADRLAAAPPPPEPAPGPLPRYPFLENPRTQLFHCVQCTTCTSVCPVVAAAGDSGLDLDATPQQIMNLVRLGLVDLALGSRMVWDCLTCYQCQENCPQGIAVTDILYELRNEAWGRLGAEDRRQPGGAAEEAS